MATRALKEDIFNDIQRLIKEEKPSFHLQYYTEEVFGLQKGTLFIHTRKREIVNARHAYIAIQCATTEDGPSVVGRATTFNHATVIYAKKAVYNHITTERIYREKVVQIVTAERKALKGVVSYEELVKCVKDVIQIIIDYGENKTPIKKVLTKRLTKVA